MLNRYTLPLISALVVSASLASCQRKVEEVTTPAEEIVFTVASSSQTKSCAAETSPVAIPVKADGGEELTLEVSSSPWLVEESSAPATKVTPSDGPYFSISHNSFGVMTYSASSEGAAPADRRLLWPKDEAVYNGATWAPSPSRAWPFAGNYLTFFGWAPYDAVTPSDNEGVPVISEFKVKENAKDQVDLLVSKVVRTDSPSLSGIRVPITFGHALTAVRFIGVRLTITSVTISGINDQGSFNMETGEWSEQRSLDQEYSSTSIATDPSSTLTLIPQTLPEGAKLKAVTSAGTLTASLAGQVWEPGKVVIYRITDPVTSFSVSETKKVRFSPGNLQAVFAAAGTSFTWKFADNQWEYVANGAANTSISGNGKVSAAGTVDLFGWSTSTTMYGIHNSESSSDYSGDFVEWGEDPNLIDALGSGWRTLTEDEWTYLLEWRGGGALDYPRYCKATVNDVPGLVIFPDGFHDLSVYYIYVYLSYYDHRSYYSIPYSNTSYAGYNSNSWSGDVWTKMESDGCVFLPAAGRRTGSEVYDNGFSGHYFSSTPDGTTNAYRLYFTNDGVDPSYSNYRSLGRSVRLVRDL